MVNCILYADLHAQIPSTKYCASIELQEARKSQAFNLSYVKLLMGHLGPSNVVTTAARSGSNLSFCHGAHNSWWRPCLYVFKEYVLITHSFIHHKQ